MANRTLIGKVEVGADGKVFLNGKPATLDAVVTGIRTAQLPTKIARARVAAERLGLKVE